MSVINQMLRDLDKQQGKPQQPVVAQPVFARAGKAAGWRWLLPLLLALLLLLQWQPQLFSQSWHWLQRLWQPVPMQTLPALAETSAATPVVMLAVQSEPVVTQAALAEPAATRPVAPQPDAPQPVVAESVVTQPDATMALVPESIVTLPATVPESAVTTATPVPTATEWQPAPAMAVSSLTIEQLPDSPELQLSQLQQRAETAKASQQLLQAAALWQQYLQLAPDRPRPYEQLAALWWQQQQWAELEQLLTQARARQIQSAQLQLQQARLAASQQQWAMVLTLLSAVPMTELLTDALPLQAQAQQQLGDYQAALGSYQQWSQLAPTSARAWLGLGLVYDQLKQTTAARAAYQQALALGGLAPASRQFIQQRLAQTE